MSEIPLCPYCKTNDHMIKHPDGTWVCHKTHILDKSDVEQKTRKADPKVICSCGTEVIMSCLGGQNQYTWKGTCISCNTEWVVDCETYMEEMEG